MKDMEASNEHITSHLLVCKPLNALATSRWVASALPHPISRGTIDRPPFDRWVRARNAMTQILQFVLADTVNMKITGVVVELRRNKPDVHEFKPCNAYFIIKPQ